MVGMGGERNDKRVEREGEKKEEIISEVSNKRSVQKQDIKS